MNGPGGGKERRGEARQGLLEDNRAWGALGNLHNLGQMILPCSVCFFICKMGLIIVPTLIVL